MTRPRQQLVFGGGLDRGTGVMVVDEASFNDLRNVYLFDGKAELRKGLYETLTFFSDEEVFHVAPIRSQALGAIFTWKASTGDIKLYRASGDGTSTIYVGVVWTLDPTAVVFPRISTADSYGKLYIAHDEPIYANRAASRVYDPSTDTLSNYQQDLYSTDVGLVDTFFRGFARHLNYLVGWGYGNENDGNRPEIVRISLPGEPDTMLPQHYVMVGQRYEPVIGCWSVGTVLVMRKETDSYRLIGESRANFGVDGPIDEQYGVVSSQLGITVQGVNYFWSLAGPRAARGGNASDDLAQLLDLAGPVPDPLAEATAQEYGFCVYDPEQREVLFVFGAWAYVLHLRNPQALRWSYRQYRVALAGGGLLYSGVTGVAGSGAGAPTSWPTLTGLTPGPTTVQVDWTNDGVLLGGEVAELWAKDLTNGGPWTLNKNNVAVAGPTGTATADGLTPSTNYALAVRFKLVGVYTSGYTSSDPYNWPAPSRGEALTDAPALTVPAAVTAAGFCAGTVPRIGVNFTITSGSGTEIETSTDGGTTWEPLTTLTNPTNSTDFGIDYDVYYSVRVRHTNGIDVSDWVVVDVGSMPFGTCG